MTYASQYEFCYLELQYICVCAVIKILVVTQNWGLWLVLLFFFIQDPSDISELPVYSFYWGRGSRSSKVNWYYAEAIPRPAAIHIRPARHSGSENRRINTANTKAGHWAHTCGSSFLRNVLRSFHDINIFFRLCHQGEDTLRSSSSPRPRFCSWLCLPLPCACHVFRFTRPNKHTCSTQNSKSSTEIMSLLLITLMYLPSSRIIFQIYFLNAIFLYVLSLQSCCIQRGFPIPPTRNIWSIFIILHN